MSLGPLGQREVEGHEVIFSPSPFVESLTRKISCFRQRAPGPEWSNQTSSLGPASRRVSSSNPHGLWSTCSVTLLPLHLEFKVQRRVWNLSELMGMLNIFPWTWTHAFHPDEPKGRVKGSTWKSSSMLDASVLMPKNYPNRVYLFSLAITRAREMLETAFPSPGRIFPESEKLMRCTESQNESEAIVPSVTGPRNRGRG